MNLMKFEEALVYLDAALANNPQDFQLHIAKAGAYRAKGCPDLALKCFFYFYFYFYFLFLWLIFDFKRLWQSCGKQFYEF